MAVTPKPVRRNGGSCICADSDGRLVRDEYETGVCRYRCCVVLRCTTCRGALVSWGPVGCKCDGGPRWARHRGMAAPGHWDFEKDRWVSHSAAVKPSSVKFRRVRPAVR